MADQVFLTHSYTGYAFRVRGAVADDAPEVIGGSFHPRKFGEWIVLDNGEGQRWMISAANAADLTEIHP